MRQKQLGVFVEGVDNQAYPLYQNKMKKIKIISIAILSGLFFQISPVFASIIVQQNTQTKCEVGTQPLQLLGSNLSGNFDDLVIASTQTSTPNVQIYQSLSFTTSSLNVIAANLFYEGRAGTSSLPNLWTFTSSSAYFATSSLQFDTTKYYWLLVTPNAIGTNVNVCGNSISDTFPQGVAYQYNGGAKNLMPTLKDLFFIVDATNPNEYYSANSELSTSTNPSIQWNDQVTKINLSYTCPDTGFNIFGFDIGRFFCNFTLFFFKPHDFSSNLILNQMTGLTTVFPFSIPLTIYQDVKNQAETSPTSTSIILTIPDLNNTSFTILTSSTMSTYLGSSVKTKVFDTISTVLWAVTGFIMLKVII